MLTTITTMFGLLPMALQINLDFPNREIVLGGPVAVWWVQLSTAIIFGLGFSTLLTLVLVPVLLAAPTVIRERRKGGLRGDMTVDRYEAATAKAAE
jgi:multidrug efflux pump